MFLSKERGIFMELVQQIAVNSDCYKSNKQITVQGLVIHSVGCPQPSAQVFANTWNKPGQRACVHAVADNNGLVIQCLPWNWRGWHVGGSANNTHIGVEMTEPSTIKYVGGANWVETGDGTNTKAHVLGTYKTAVELFAYLCNEFNLDPLKDGVILSHHEAHLRGLGSNHGDVEHLWNHFGLSMVGFRQDIYNKMKELNYNIATQQEVDMNNLTMIMGTPIATIEQCKSVMQKNNVNEKYISLVYSYYTEGIKEGVRGDIALAQSCLETGWFNFKGDVVPAQNNFAGLGTTGDGVKGCYFNTPEEGIRAQIQHLKAYASTEPLKQECIDPRYSLVSKGCAPYVEWLGQKENPTGKGWATGKNYGAKILNLLNSFINESVTAPPTTPTTTLPSTPSQSVETEQKETAIARYVARLDFNKPETQIGCYNILSNAILKIEEVTPYKIFSSETGEVIYESAYAKLGRPKPFIVIADKQVSAYVEPFGKQATLLDAGEYEVVITYSMYGLIIGQGWVSLSDVKIKSDKTEEQEEGIEFTDKNGNKTIFSQADWDELVRLWAYTGVAEELINKYTIQELRTILQNK